MRFLLIISHDDSFRPTDALVADIGRWIREMDLQGVRIHGNPLRPAGEARTVRVRDGRTTVTAGPFAGSREKMCAYELIECAGMDEAVATATRHPMAKAATIEVRPIWSELARD